MSKPFKDLPILMDKIKERLRKIDPTVAAASFAQKELGLRIFTKGRATEGDMIGRYKKGKDGKRSYYMKKRLTAGRQVSYKDLEFTGDLRKSITFGSTGKTQTEWKSAVFFDNDKSPLIAEGQEKQTGKSIFEYSDKEIDAIYENADQYLHDQLVKIFNEVL